VAGETTAGANRAELGEFLWYQSGDHVEPRSLANPTGAGEIGGADLGDPQMPGLMSRERILPDMRVLVPCGPVAASGAASASGWRLAAGADSRERETGPQPRNLQAASLARFAVVQAVSASV
jgi:hypothetical protein